MATDHSVSRLRLALRLGLGFMALVVIIAQIIAAKVPADSVVSVHIVHLASRQQMLCQRITLSALQIHDGSAVPKAKAREELDAALGEFARTHHALSHGDPEIGLPGDNSPEINQLLANIERWFRDVSSAGEALLAEDEASPAAERLLQVLLEAEPQFSSRMKAIVETYEQETAASMKRFRDLENVILALTFLSLVALALGVLRPMIKNVENEMQSRRRAENKLTVQAEELRLAAEKAEAAVRAKSRFLSSMSHEMRTPLNGVVGMAQVMEDTDLDEEQRGGLAVIKSSSLVLLALISDVLDLGKIEAGRLDLEKIAFDLPDLVKKTLQIVEPAAGAKSLEISLELAAGTPQHVLGDSTRLQQVILNLLSNAVKFTSEGGIALRVKACEGPDPRLARVRFEVSDSGIGISPEQEQRIFRSFTQADESTTRKYGGTGLGLAISRHLVERMGGALAVDSQPGEGSTFHFEIELPLAESAPHLAESPEEPVREDTPSLEVLVVDDIALNRLVARKLLEKLGHQVEEAADGIEAVEAVQKKAYNVVFMDLEMPRLDGLQATGRIRQLDGDRAQTPIIALTAKGLAGDREKALASGCDDYLSKPIHRSALVQALGRITANLQTPSGAV